MDPSGAINSATGRTLQEDLSVLLPPLGVSTGQNAYASRAICIAGIPVMSRETLVARTRPFFLHFGINVDKLLELEEANRKTSVDQEAEAAEPKFKCPICMGAYDRPTAIKTCGHVFCECCIVTAVRKQKKCPTCRTKATKRHLLKIYLS